MAKLRKRLNNCIACGRCVEWEAWAAGPVCYPCYYAAKLVHEQGIEKVEDIPPALCPLFEMLFKKGGYDYPADLRRALVERHFDKCDTDLRRWWSPKRKPVIGGRDEK